MEAIKLNFESPVHFGSGKEEMDKSFLLYHSDALKSAIFSVGLSIYPEWAEDYNSFFDGFKISSCFPFHKEELFLPRPYGLMKFNYGNELENDKNRKVSKKVSFLSMDIYKKWAENPGEEVLIDKNCISPDGGFVFSKKENVAVLFQNDVQQRVMVNPEGEDSRPFYLDRIYFTQESGLYFFLDCRDEGLRRKILNSLHLLGSFGIGMDRTVGNGMFSFDEEKDIENIELPGNNKTGKKISLGLYLPKEDELKAVDLENSTWQLIRRGGYMAASSVERFRSLRKKNIYFFTEGSSFQTDGNLSGKLVDLRPEWNDSSMHPVWRDGRPIFMEI